MRNYKQVVRKKMTTKSKKKRAQTFSMKLIMMLMHLQLTKSEHFISAKLWNDAVTRTFTSRLFFKLYII